MPLTGAHSVGDTGHVTDHNLIDSAILALQGLVPSAPVLSSLVSAKGDLITATGNASVSRLAVGSNGQALVADSSQAAGVKWGSATDAGSVQKSTATAKGDLLIATASGVITRLGVGSDGQVLTADSSQTPGAKWASGLALTSNPPSNLAATAAIGNGTATAHDNHVHSFVGITNVAVPQPEIGAYAAPSHTNTTTSTSAYSSGGMFLLPLDVAVSTDYDLIETNIFTAGTGTGLVIRMGYYADDGTFCRPTGAALFDAGTVSATSGTGAFHVSITKTLAPGRYWLAWTLQGTVSSSPTMVVLNTNNQVGLTDTGNNSWRSWYQSGVSGALPSIGTLSRRSQPPMIALRVAA